MPSSPLIHPLPSRMCGPLCGLCGFAVAMSAGLLASADATTVLLRAIISCLGCYGLGLAVGHVFEVIALRVVDRERAIVGDAERARRVAENTTSDEDV